MRTIPILVILFAFFCCDEVDQSVQKEEWMLIQYIANTTSCCFAFDEHGTIDENDHPHPIFEMLLGLEDQGFHKTTLSLNGSGTFSIMKDGHPTMHGTTEIDARNLRLKNGHHTFDMKILNRTTDSLLVEAKGYDCGITKVKMTFIAGR